MEIRKLTTNDLGKLCAFNQKVFPERKIPYKEYIDFWLSKSEDEIGLNLILVDESNDIHGQILSSSMSYFYKGEKHDSLWGFDLIVEESFRKDNWGLDIQVYRNDLFPSSYGTGVAPDALKIQALLGNSLLGHLKKYLAIVNPLWSISSIGRGVVPVHKFPKEVNVDGYVFKMINKEDLPYFRHSFNSELWEPSRDKSYLEWRFFSPLHEYAFYYNEKSSSYFVMRTAVFKHITMNMLVDYRCGLEKSFSMECIVKAAKIITSKIRLAIVVTGSSLAAIDAVLEKQGFRPSGEPRPMNGLIDVKDKKEEIKARRFAFVTFADSDGETDIF